MAPVFFFSFGDHLTLSFPQEAAPYFVEKTAGAASFTVS